MALDFLMHISISKIEIRQREIPEDWDIGGYEYSRQGRGRLENNSLKLPSLHLHVF